MPSSDRRDNDNRFHAPSRDHPGHLPAAIKLDPLCFAGSAAGCKKAIPSPARGRTRTSWATGISQTTSPNCDAIQKAAKTALFPEFKIRLFQ